MDLNYFVCTLGEAAHTPGGRPFRTVTHLIEQQAQQHPDLPALGFYIVPPSSDGGAYGHNVLTFKAVYDGVIATAGLLSPLLDVSPEATVGLLSSSSPEFLFVWLGCIWLGHAVLLIAPECSATGITNLCQECDVSTLIVDKRNEDVGQQATRQELDRGQPGKLKCVKQPFAGRDIFVVLSSYPKQTAPAPHPDDEAVAYFHHTSGTSTGKPKPIPQTHYGSIGVLPALEGRDYATFTTTPLYHGGPADTFRAWSSNAMIWLFPSKDVPITAGNIVKCLQSSKEATESGKCSPVRYFGAVPYVLQMMAENESGTDWLRSMDLVSVGGAALPEDLGNGLVEQGVNLVSRFGSAESGFLLSSHRHYKNDRDWQYLRLAETSTQVKFEEREDGIMELVVLPEWPHMAKRNRDDGSYASSDLFEPHQKKRNAWRYHSRADSQLTLVTGLKFDPASLEAAISLVSPLVVDAMVFGNQKPYPGVLLFRSEEAASLSDDELIQHMAPLVEKACSRGQSHARIPRSMLVPMPYSKQPLDKSNKGTILRGKAEERYSERISSAYGKDDYQPNGQCSDEELLDVIKGIVVRPLAAQKDIDVDVDLFNAGVDSVASIQIRNNLQKLLPGNAGRLPTTIVEDCGTINNLLDHVMRVRHGQVEDSKGDVQDQMSRMVEEYSKFVKSPQLTATNGIDCSNPAPKVVVLTGATGALGSQVLDILRNDPAVCKIYCLVRGADVHAAHERVSKALSQRQLRFLTAGDTKVEVLQAALAARRLGLDDPTYDRLAREAAVIMHLAWSVNFRLKLPSFAKDVAAVQNLVNLALSSTRAECPRLVFCSSTASVMAYKETIPEQIIDDPTSASNTGYSQSKWVAEHVCNRANNENRLRGNISVFRVGQLSGDTRTGVWNSKEAWPLMLSTVKLLGALPDLGDEVLDWLPVDLAAQAMVEGAAIDEASEGTLRVCHILNDNRKPTWRDMLGWLSKRVSFETVSPTQWVNRLAFEADKGSNHPALQLLDHWKKAYQDKGSSDGEQQQPVRFQMEKTRALIPSLRVNPAVDEAYFNKLWEAMEQ